MLPWSVMPTAGWPSAAAAATTSSIRAAPSSIEYSVWRWRWTNDLANVAPGGPLPRPQALSTGLWMNHTGVVRRPFTPRPAVGRPRTATSGTSISPG